MTNMKIQIKEKTKGLEKDNWFIRVLGSLEDLNCELYVKGLTKLTQSEQRIEIIKLQKHITKHLTEKHPDYKWEMEHIVSDKRDSIDIYGERGNEIVIIELDKWRADQVAKKLISISLPLS